MKQNPQVLILLHYFREFLVEAAAEGLTVAPLKGAHLLTSVYPPGEDRGPMSDVDFLVPEAEFEATASLLGRMGYARRALVTRRATDRIFYEAGFARPLSHGGQVFFEAHRQLVQPGRHPIDHGALWKRSRPGTLDGAPCRRLCVEDHALHAAIHLMTDCFASPARGLRDLQLLLGPGGADPEVLLGRARAWRCTRALWLALWLLEQRAPGTVPGTLRGPLSPPREVRLALTLLVPDAQGLRLDPGTKRRRQALLWPLLFDDGRAFLRYAAGYLHLRWQDVVERRR